MSISKQNSINSWFFISQTNILHQSQKSNIFPQDYLDLSKASLRTLQVLVDNVFHSLKPVLCAQNTFTLFLNRSFPTMKESFFLSIVSQGENSSSIMVNLIQQQIAFVLKERTSYRPCCLCYYQLNYMVISVAAQIMKI